MDMQREPLGRRVPSDLGKPVGRARTHGVGGEADGDAASPKLPDLWEIPADGRRGEALDPAARVGREQDDDRDPGRGGRVEGGERLVEAEVVELADGGVPAGEQLAI